MTQPSHLLRRRHVLQLMAGTTGALFLHACQSQGDSAGEGGLAMSMGTAPWVGQMPLYIAQEKGFFTEEGLDFKDRKSVV